MFTRCGEQAIYLKWKQNLFSHALVEKALARAWKDLVSVLTKHPCHSLLMWNNNTLFRNEEDHTVNCRQDDLEISVFLVIISKKREISPLLREGWLSSENRVLQDLILLPYQTPLQNIETLGLQTHQWSLESM